MAALFWRRSIRSTWHALASRRGGIRFIVRDVSYGIVRAGVVDVPCVDVPYGMCRTGWLRVAAGVQYLLIVSLLQSFPLRPFSSMRMNRALGRDGTRWDGWDGIGRDGTGSDADGDGHGMERTQNRRNPNVNPNVKPA